jgi:phage host-nuclease inhibitor protein Gam
MHNPPNHCTITRAEAEAAVTRALQAENQLQAIATQINIEVAAVESKFTQSKQIQQDILTNAQAVVASYFEANRKELLEGELQSTKFGPARVGFRKSPTKVVYTQGTKAADVIKRIKALGSAVWRRALKTTTGIDKKALLAQAREADPETLRQLGIEVVQDESFFIEQPK